MMHSFNSHLQLHVQLRLRERQDADGGLRLAQLIVDADERLHSRVCASRILKLLVMQRLGKSMAFLRKRTQGPAHILKDTSPT